MFHVIIHAIILITLTSVSAMAEDLASPTGDVILTISGNVAMTNGGAITQLDLEMLEALEATKIETSTIWTTGLQVFEGVSLAVLVKEFGVSGGTVRATAINDYTIEIPLTDAVAGGPIVAYRLNAEAMLVRNKGPLWIIYPYDAEVDYRSEVIYSRSIWQLDHIEAVD